MFCAAAIAFAYSSAWPQDNREVNPVDLSVHSGVDEQKQDRQTQPDPAHDKKPAPYSTWSSSPATQSPSTRSWRTGKATSTPAETDDGTPGQPAKLPAASSPLPSQRNDDRSTRTATGPTALLPMPPDVGATPPLFTTFDPKPFGSIGTTPFSDLEFQQPQSSLTPARSKPNPPKATDAKKAGRTTSSAETAKHQEVF